MNTIDDRVIASVLEVLQSGRLFRYDCETAAESPTALLEKAFADCLGVKYAIAMNSCSSAMFTALLSAGVRRGDRVLMPAFTFTAVPSVIVQCGATPVPIEITDDYVIDCDDLEAKATECKAQWLLLSHMRGRVSDIDRVLSICERHDVEVIEDCAHSLGVQWKGTPTGRFGRAAAYSAQSYKILDAGEGGILATDDAEIACRAMVYSGCYEKNWRKHFAVDGKEKLLESLVNSIPTLNFRMSNLTAAALLPQIEMIDARVDRYNQNYDVLCSVLSSSEWITLPKFLPHVRPAADSIQFRINGLPSEMIGKFVQNINEHGLKLSVFGVSDANARCFWNWNFFERNEPCDRTRSLLTNTADMRLRLHLEPADLRSIGTAIIDELDRCAAASAVL